MPVNSKHAQPLWLVSNFFQLLALFVFLTGGVPFLKGRILEIIALKPWIHRGAISMLTLTGFLLFAFHQEKAHSQKAPVPWLTAFCSKLNLSPKIWLSLIYFWLASVWTISSWVRHDTFRSSFDLAIFTQAVWNTVHGSFMYSSIKGGINLMGDHFSPLLAAAALPYAIWPDAKTLLLFQALGAASGVFPIYELAKQKSQDFRRGLLFAALFALYLPGINAVRFDFHVEVLALPLFLWASVFFEKSDLRLCSLFLAAALLSKENAALSTFAFGAYALTQKKFRYGIFWILFSAAYFWIVTQRIIPLISKQDYFYLSGNFLAWRQEGLGAFLKHLLSPASFSYLIKIFMPLGMLSFLAPAPFLLCLPALIQNLTARNEAVLSIFFQYTAFLTPFVFISAIYGASRFKNLKRLAYGLTAASLCLSGVSEIYVISAARLNDQPRFKEIRDYLRSIPPEASVRTHEFFAPHAANRRELHIFENQNPKEGARPQALASQYVVLDDLFLAPATKPTQLRALYASGYRLIYQKEGFRVFKK